MREKKRVVRLWEKGEEDTRVRRRWGRGSTATVEPANCISQHCDLSQSEKHLDARDRRRSLAALLWEHVVVRIDNNLRYKARLKKERRTGEGQERKGGSSEEGGGREQRGGRREGTARREEGGNSEGEGGGRREERGGRRAVERGKE